MTPTVANFRGNADWLKYIIFVGLQITSEQKFLTDLWPDHFSQEQPWFMMYVLRLVTTYGKVSEQHSELASATKSLLGRKSTRLQYQMWSWHPAKRTGKRIEAQLPQLGVGFHNINF